jgi:uncharacterized protein YjbJ (UPF0337 family)
MNKDILKGQWNQFVGAIKQKWGKLTDDDLKYVDGSFDKLVGKIQEHYGRSKEEAEKEVQDYKTDAELHEAKS